METITADHPITSSEAEIDLKIVTTKQKRCQVIKICILAVLTILSLTFFLSDVVITVKNVNKVQELKTYIQHRLEISSKIPPLQIERNDTDNTKLEQLRSQQLQFNLSSLGGKETNNKDANFVAAYVMIVKSIKEFETEKILGAAYFFEKNVTSQFQTIFLKKVRGETFLEAARLLSPNVNDNYLSFAQEVNTSLWLGKLKTKRQQLSSNPPNISDTGPFEWLNLTSKYSDLLVHLRNEEAQRILLSVEGSIRKTTFDPPFCFRGCCRNHPAIFHNILGASSK